MSLKFLSCLRPGDILVMETYFFWSSYAFDALHDTVVFKIYEDDKQKRCQLDSNIFAYHNWFNPKLDERVIVPSGIAFTDSRVSGLDGANIMEFDVGLDLPEYSSHYSSGFINLSLVINNLPAMIESRAILLNFAEFDYENDSPSFIECYYFY